MARQKFLFDTDDIKYGEFAGFPELVDFAQDVGQGQARQNVWNIAWDVPIEKPDEPFHCERKISEGWDFSESKIFYS